jgi:hypothetical protein
MSEKRLVAEELLKICLGKVYAPRIDNAVISPEFAKLREKESAPLKVDMLGGVRNSISGQAS